jgi:hypothetical protein
MFNWKTAMRLPDDAMTGAWLKEAAGQRVITPANLPGPDRFKPPRVGIMTEQRLQPAACLP